MMKLNTNFFALGLIGLTLGACTDSIDDGVTYTDSDKTIITRNFLFEEDSDSRTSVQGNVIKFSAVENFFCFAGGNTANGIVSVAEQTITRGAGGAVTFSHAATVDESTSYDYLFISPSLDGVNASVNSTWETATISLSETQNPTAITFDPKQDVLISERVNIDDATIEGKQINTKFKRMFTFLKLTIPKAILTSNGVDDTDKIFSVSITGAESDVLTGSATVPITTGTSFADTKLTFTESSNKVTASYADGADFGENFEVWLVVNQGVITNPTIEIKTANSTITQNITTGNITLNADKINNFVFAWSGNTSITTTTADPSQQKVDLTGSNTLATALNGVDLTKMTKLTITGAMTEADMIYTRQFPAVTTLDMSGATLDKMPEYLYSDDSKNVGEKFPIAIVLEHVSLPSGLTIVPKWSFERCLALISVVIPEGYTMINNSAFEGCKALTTISFPSSMVSIQIWAFEKTGFVTFEAPLNLTYLGKEAFVNAKSLTTFKFRGPAPDVGKISTAVFKGTAAGFKILVPTAYLADYQAHGNLSAYTIEAY